MKDDDKCFIKIKNGIFEEISYQELKNRRKKINEVHMMLLDQ